jgi:hypothetical protein
MLPGASVEHERLEWRLYEQRAGYRELPRDLPGMWRISIRTRWRIVSRAQQLSEPYIQHWEVSLEHWNVFHPIKIMQINIR